MSNYLEEASSDEEHGIFAEKMEPAQTEVEIANIKGLILSRSFTS